MTPDAARHATADALILVGNLVAAGQGEPRRSLMVVHVDRWQADDLIAVMDEVRDYVDISGHENYQGWLPGSWRLHLIVDRTVAPHPEITAILAGYDREDLPDGAAGYPVGAGPRRAR